MTSMGCLSRDKSINDVLMALRDNFDEGFREVPVDARISDSEFLLCTLGTEHYAYPIAHALEIVQVPRILPVPKMHPAVQGIVNFRGRITSVTSIHPLLDMAPPGLSPRSRVIIGRNLPVETGFLVDRLDDLIAISDDELLPLAPTVAETKRRLLAGQILHKGKTLLCLDMQGICASDALCVAYDEVGDQT